MSVRGQWEAGLAREKWLSVKVSGGTCFHHAEKFSEDATD